MTKLLTSVRNLEEAKIACQAGSDWLDLKEPKDGALGAVAPQTVAEVVKWANQYSLNTPISATIGDCWDRPMCMAEKVNAVSQHGVDFVKIGIYADHLSSALGDAIRQSIAMHPNLIVLCFAERPPTSKTIDRIIDLGAKGLMLDTAEKSTGRLTEKLSYQAVSDFVMRVQASGCLCGVAGSLQIEDIKPLVETGADYLGFRGALCTLGDREGRIDESNVRKLKKKIQACLTLIQSRERPTGEIAGIEVADTE